MLCGGLADFLMRRAGRPEKAGPDQLMDLGQPAALESDDPPTHARWGRRQMPAPAEEEAIQFRIERALANSLSREGSDIHVEVRGGKAVLRGAVGSWGEEAEAERIAFDMPGIQEVENRLEVAR